MVWKHVLNGLEEKKIRRNQKGRLQSSRSRIFTFLVLPEREPDIKRTDIINYLLVRKDIPQQKLVYKFKSHQI